MESNDDRNMGEVFGPGKPLSDADLTQMEADWEQQQAEYEQSSRALSLLALVVDAGTAREKKLWCFDPDVTPIRVWEPLTSGIEAAQGALVGVLIARQRRAEARDNPTGMTSLRASSQRSWRST